MFIKYTGFTVVATDRYYNFSVGCDSDEPRKFIVGIPSTSFVRAQLKYQDGPGISFRRLKVEIDQESSECPAKTQLTISGLDIEDYLVTQHPKKGLKRKRGASEVAAQETGAIL
jgi:hypothetical protein